MKNQLSLKMKNMFRAFTILSVLSVAILFGGWRGMVGPGCSCNADTRSSNPHLIIK